MSNPISRPLCYAIKSRLNGKYLTYESGESNYYRRGIIKASGVDAVDPRARFFIEPTDHNKPLGDDDAVVHIRCSYNNTYWSATNDNDENEWSIYAEEEADRRTAFQARRFSIGSVNDYFIIYCPFPYWYYTTAGESHALSGRLVRRQLESVWGPATGDGNHFLFINLENQVVLPPRVCFRGDNGMYLCVPSTDEEHRYLQFKSIDDNVYSSAMHTTDIYSDGTIRIKSEAAMKYWKRGTIREEGWLHGRDGIWVDSDGTNRNDPDILFLAQKHGDRIALKSLGNNRYCKRLTIKTEGSSTSDEAAPSIILSAADEDITGEALLQLAGEPLQSRVINVLEYRLEHATVYGKKTVELEGKSDGGGIQSNKIRVKFELTQQSTWTTTVTEKEAVKTLIKAKVPFVVDSFGKLQLGKDDIVETIIWGETITHTRPKWEDYFVNASSDTKLQASATQCTYEVPFSYSQEDTFTDIEKYTIVYQDGLYRGVNCCDIKYAHA